MKNPKTGFIYAFNARFTRCIHNNRIKLLHFLNKKNIKLTQKSNQFLKTKKLLEILQEFKTL